jgi:hypothetical protein
VKVTIALSCLLILATILGTTSRTLPETTQITFVEIWMMFVVLLTFAEIGLHTLVGYIQGLEKENNNLVSLNKVSSGKSAKSSWSLNDDETKTLKLSKRINRNFGRIFFPSLFMICTITYVIIAICTSNVKHDINVSVSPECENQ